MGHLKSESCVVLLGWRVCGYMAFYCLKVLRHSRKAEVAEVPCLKQEEFNARELAAQVMEDLRSPRE